MFQFPRFASRPYGFRAGCPERAGSPFGDPRVIGCLPPRRGFSQAATSFIASCRLGIHRMRLFAWPYNPNRPPAGGRMRHFDFSRAAPPGTRLRGRRGRGVCMCAFPELLKIPGRQWRPASPRLRALAARHSEAPSAFPRSLPSPALPAAPWWSQGGSNSRPPACKAGALPAELWPRAGCGAGRGLPAPRPLDWWVWEESNLPPHPYQGCALTN